MNVDEFWSVVEAADRDYDTLVGLLATRSPEEVLAFQGHFDDATDRLRRPELHAAAYIIGGGASDDAFAYFQAGLIALGRDWYERAAASPDVLADHPDVIEAATEGADEVLSIEEFAYAADDAYERRTGRNLDAFTAAQPERPWAEIDYGDLNFDDAATMHRLLPQLSALYRI